MNIPKENSKEAIIERRKLLKQQLKPFIGRSIVCPDLGNVPVAISGKSVDEISHHAAKSYRSTMAALDLEHQIKIAKFYKYSKPKPNGQVSPLGFLVMIEMRGIHDGHPTKLTIGVRVRNAKERLLQYCITSPE